jgi:hypothetical protein
VEPELVKNSRAVFEHVDEFLCRSTNPAEALANDLGIVRLPRGQVECRPAGISPTVPPDDVGDGFGLDFAFRPLGVVVNVEHSSYTFDDSHELLTGCVSNLHGTGGPGADAGVD